MSGISNKFKGIFNAENTVTFNIGNLTVLAIGCEDETLNAVTLNATSDGGKKVRDPDSPSSEWSLTITADSAGSVIPLPIINQFAGFRDVTFTTSSSVEGETLILYTKELG